MSRSTNHVVDCTHRAVNDTIVLVSRVFIITLFIMIVGGVMATDQPTCCVQWLVKSQAGGGRVSILYNLHASGSMT